MIERTSNKHTCIIGVLTVKRCSKKDYGLQGCDTASPGTTRSTTQSCFSDNPNSKLCPCEKLQNSHKYNYDFWKLWAFISLLMNFRMPKNVGNFLT